MGVWRGGGKTANGMVGYWPQRTRFYFWEFWRSCQFCWKSLKKCDRESARRRIHRLTDANRFLPRCM